MSPGFLYLSISQTTRLFLVPLSLYSPCSLSILSLSLSLSSLYPTPLLSFLCFSIILGFSPSHPLPSFFPHFDHFSEKILYFLKQINNIIPYNREMYRSSTVSCTATWLSIIFKLSTGHSLMFYLTSSVIFFQSFLSLSPQSYFVSSRALS